MATESHAVPTHLGLILDGNRRWAKEHGLPTLEGHKKGYENLKTIGKDAIKRGIRYVSAYVFSTENWKRSAEEVDYLMKLLIWVAKNEVKELDEAGIRVVFAGSKERLSSQVVKAMQAAEHRTAKNSRGTLILCLNYGGHQEIVDACNGAIEQGKTKLTLQDIEQNLYSPQVPPVDFIIRTSGEQRISNFMLWRAAYSELYFTSKYWPAFSTDDLSHALSDYERRKRRFGE